jgi:hypothetical protein
MREWLGATKKIALLILCGIALGCQRQEQYVTPLHPVHYTIYFNSAEGHMLIPIGGYLRVTKPSTAYSAIGFGGILVIHGFMGSDATDYYYAYDLACPNEVDPKISLVVNERLEAECPQCHSRYSIVYGGGTPIAGPSQHHLLPYRVLPIDGGLLITTPEL